MAAASVSRITGELLNGWRRIAYAVFEFNCVPKRKLYKSHSIEETRFKKVEPKNTFLSS